MKRHKPKLSAREVAVCLRVQSQLIAMRRTTRPEPDVHIAEYLAMDRTLSMMEIPEETRRMKAKVRGYYFIRFPVWPTKYLLKKMKRYGRVVEEVLGANDHR